MLFTYELISVLYCPVFQNTFGIEDSAQFSHAVIQYRMLHRMYSTAHIIYESARMGYSMINTYSKTNCWQLCFQQMETATS